MNRSDVAPNLMLFLDRLKAYIVDWKFTFVPTENTEYEPGIDRSAIDLRDPDANVISSELKAQAYTLEEGRLVPTHRHVVAIDIDHEAWLVPSSTAGHSHLYVDIPGGIAWEDYRDWLVASAKIGLIEDGYAEVSIKRGHTDLRLPWVSKADQKLATVEEMSARASEAPEPEWVDWDIDANRPLFDAVVDPF